AARALAGRGSLPRRRPAGGLTLRSRLLPGPTEVGAVGGAIHHVRERHEERRVGQRTEETPLDSRLLVHEREDDEEERQEQARAVWLGSLCGAAPCDLPTLDHCRDEVAAEVVRKVAPVRRVEENEVRGVPGGDPADIPGDSQDEGRIYRAGRERLRGCELKLC